MVILPNPQLRGHCLEAMRRAIEFARAHFAEPPASLDAEATHPDNMPADQRSRVLAALHKGGIEADPYLTDHPGDAPTAADILTHQEIVSVLRLHYPGAYFAGEEATKEENERAMAAPPESHIFVIDAIDGSEQHEALSFGFSTNILVFRRTAAERTVKIAQRHDQLLLAATLNSSMICLGWDHATRSAFAGDAVDTNNMHEWQHEEVKDNVIAVVGAKESAPYRPVMMELLKDPALRVYGAGGAPAAPGLGLGNLGAMVHPRAHASWDSPELPALALLGANIVPLNQRDFSILGFDDITALIGRPDYLTKSTIPPIVVTRNLALAVTLHERLGPLCLDW